MIDELGLDPMQTPPAPEPGSADRDEQHRVAAQLLAEQSPGGAIAGGLVASLAGALAWGVVAYVWSTTLGILAIGLGALVGFGVKLFGRGVTAFYQYLAAGFAVFGCAAGHLAAIVMFSLGAGGAGLGDLLSASGRDDLLAFYVYTLNFMDIVFWLFAVYGAWWFAKRDLTREQALAMHRYELDESG